MAKRRVPFRFGPAPEPPPPPRPFTVLAKPRFVPPGLSSDLTAWYRAHEGVGLGAPLRHSVRLCKYAELQPVRARDLGRLGENAGPAWEDFRAIRIAIGRFSEEIVYVLAGSRYQFGSIVALGRDVPSDGILVLDVNLSGWMARLKRDDWVEWGLEPGEFKTLPGGKATTLRRHFERLNPGLKW